LLLSVTRLTKGSIFVRFGLPCLFCHPIDALSQSHKRGESDRVSKDAEKIVAAVAIEDGFGDMEDEDA
jgi:hypothetical protein